MKKVWLKSDSVCMAMGDAVALNLMFETQQDHELFFAYWKKYLGNMATLLNYHLTPTGWVLLFKTKSREQIQEAYKLQRRQSRKAKAMHTLHDTSRILSEHFRIFLSQFVRRTNAIHQRKGTKVLQSFHRYVLNELADYEYFFDKITRQIDNKAQKAVKYQADEKGYDVKNEMKKDSIWKVGTRMYQGMEKGFRERFGVWLVKPQSNVLRKLMMNPKNHNSAIPPP